MRKYFSYTYNRYSEEMSYYLFCPIRNLNRPLPLIVWLHGSGECGVNRKTFMREGLPAVLNNWTLRPFGAYILCPQLNVEDDIWAKDESVNKIMDIINEVISENNINTNKIILCGHSLGAMGCTYIAERIHNFFSCVCLLSGYEIGVDLSQITDDILGVVGMLENNEDPESVDFMIGHFKEHFGKDKLWELSCDHANVPALAFLDDADLDGKSDLISWMFSHKLKNHS